MVTSCGGDTLFKRRIAFIGITDGLVNGLLLYMLGEFLVSPQITYTNFLLFTITMAFASVFFSWLLVQYAKEKIWKVYSIGRIVSVLVAVLVFVNYLQFHFHIFPRRELGNIDGIIIIVVQSVFIFVSELLRVNVFAVVALLKKFRSKTGDGLHES